MRSLFRKHLQDTPQLIDAQAHSRAVPSSGLTRWLRQGVEHGMCPMCRVAHKADREFIWQFSEEGFGDEHEAAKLADAHGFCSEHAQMLVRIDLEVQSMLGVSTIYVDLCERLGRRLDELDVSAALECARCPACVSRDRALAQNAGYLLQLLSVGGAGAVSARFPDSPGLCLPHFALVWSSPGGSIAARELLLDVERRSVATIRADLDELIRKEGVEARHEPKGAEQDAWQRAVWLTSGWPAPTQSAGTPEPDAFLHPDG